MAVVNEEFVGGAAFKVWTTTEAQYDRPGLTSHSYSYNTTSTLLTLQGQVNSTSQRLSTAECIAAYGKTYVTDGTDFLLVTKTKKNDTTSSVLDFWTAGVQDSFHWVCSDYATEHPGGWTCNTDQARGNSTSWHVKGHAVEYCLAGQVAQRCRFEFSLQLLIVVTGSNLLKATCMAATAWKQKTPTLVTVGDAISSFPEFQDPTAIGRCMMLRDDVVKDRWMTKQAALARE